MKEKTKNEKFWVIMISISCVLIGILLVMSFFTFLYVLDDSSINIITGISFIGIKDFGGKDFTVKDGVVLDDIENDWGTILIRASALCDRYNQSIDINKSIGFDSFYRDYFNYFNYSQRYDSDMNRDYIQTPKEFIYTNYTGDCDDSATFLACVAKKYGENVSLVVGTSHMWLMINGTDYQSTRYEICDDCVRKWYSNYTSKQV